jgi:hypothetical protein
MGMEHAVIMSALGSAASMVQGAQQASAARKQQAATMAHQRQQAALRQRIEERKLERERRSEEASARARLGASGVGSSGGSGAAVLRGLNADYDQALHDSQNLVQRVHGYRVPASWTTARGSGTSSRWDSRCSAWGNRSSAFSNRRDRVAAR